MATMAPQITSLVYSTVYSGADKKNFKAPRHWPLCGEFTGTGEFPTQRASNAENVFIWWCHHVNMARQVNIMLVGNQVDEGSQKFPSFRLSTRKCATKIAAWHHVTQRCVTDAIPQCLLTDRVYDGDTLPSLITVKCVIFVICYIGLQYNEWTCLHHICLWYYFV